LATNSLWAVTDKIETGTFGNRYFLCGPSVKSSRGNESLIQEFGRCTREPKRGGVEELKSSIVRARFR
jgi:hypothetical protein